MVLDFLFAAFHICLCISHLFVEFSLKLFFGKAFGFEFVLC